MAAGEEIEVEFYAFWPEEDLMPHDFSLGIWSEKEPVTLSAVNSDHSRAEFPVFEPDHSIEIPTDFPDWSKPGSGMVSLLAQEKE